MSQIVDDINLQAGLRPDKIALHDLAQDRYWTYSGLDDVVARCASYLVSQGLETGDRIAVLSRNRAEFIILHFACARLGSIFVPLNWRLSKAEIQSLLEDAEPAVVFAEPDFENAPDGSVDINGLLTALEASPAT